MKISTAIAIATKYHPWFSELPRIRCMLFAVALVSGFACLSGCGGTVRTEGSSAKAPVSVPVSTGAASSAKTSSMPVSGASDLDGDSDSNNDDYRYGKAATATDRQAVAVLVKRYYNAAAAADGATGCSLIYSLLAEEIPELYGEPPGPPQLRGTTCAAVMTKFFRQNHRQLVIDSATLEVKGVRVKRNRALAILAFASMPQRDILVHREHLVWKIDELQDTALG